MAPREGFEPPTDRLTADCSTTELPRNCSFKIHKNNNIEFNLHTNTAFIEFDLYNKVNYDKHIISKYLINIIKVRNYKYGRHIVLLRNFDKLTFNAFMTLRRMMELYSQNVLFITISTNLSKIPDSIKSRCFKSR